MFDTIAKVLEWVDQYGADKVFMVWFFFLYWRAGRRNEKLQDARLADSKEALGALIEAKQVLDLLEAHVEEVENKVDRNYERCALCPRNRKDEND